MDEATQEQDQAGQGSAPPWLRSFIEQIEGNESLDVAADKMIALWRRVGDGPAGDTLRGERFGHALHPAVTDLPLGCWTASALLDLVGGKRSRAASQRLVGLGVLLAVPTAMTGMAEGSRVDDEGQRRVTTVHAAGNTLVTVLYLKSWRSRRRGRHLRGIFWGLTGGSIAVVTGYLGGHLSFGRSVGVGARGLQHSGGSGGTGAGEQMSVVEVTEVIVTEEVVAADPFRGGADGGVQQRIEPSETVEPRRAAEVLGVDEERLRAMVDEGLLEPADLTDSGPRFRYSDLEAVRMMGG